VFKYPYIYIDTKLNFKTDNIYLKNSTMKTRNIFVFVLFLLPALTFAGEIFGTLKKDGKPVAKQEVLITQGGKTIGRDTTDAKGYYSITVKPVGQCKLEVSGYEGAVYSVVSTNNSVDYTLSLVKAGDKWELKKM